MLMTEAAKMKVQTGSTQSHFGSPSFHLHTSLQLQTMLCVLSTSMNLALRRCSWLTTYT